MAKILDGFQESMVKLYRDQHANKFVPLRPQVAQCVNNMGVSMSVSITWTKMG